MPSPREKTSKRLDSDDIGIVFRILKIHLKI